jgi:twinkle protein
MAVYDDGSTYCFSCEESHKGNTGEQPAWTEEHKPPKLTNQTLLEGSHQALAKRGLTITTCQKYDYRVTKFNSTPVQVATYRDNSRQPIAQHLRTPDKDFLWLGDARKVQLFGQHLFKMFGKKLVITEGEIDCMTIAQAFNLKYPVVSVPSGSTSAKKYIKRHLEYVCSFDEVVLAFDEDDAGKTATEEVATLLPPGKVKIMSYDGYKDANELYLVNPARVAQCVYDAELWRPDGILSGTSLWETIMAVPEKGFEMPYPKLNTRTQGIVKDYGYGLLAQALANQLPYMRLCTTWQ